MEGSGANEDTFPSPVISALDAELTYLQKKAGAPVPARLANTSLGFDSGRFSGFAEVCTLCKCIHSIQTLCWTRTSRLGLNCSGDVATQAVLNQCITSVDY